MTNNSLKNKLYKIIFESDTPAGKGFDLLLIVSILFSVIVVLLDSVQNYNNLYGKTLYIMEWFFTILFTIEYFIRIYCIGKPILYIKSFYGIIDFLSIIPTYISIFLPASRYLSVIRILRVLRIFRILKLENICIQGKMKRLLNVIIEKSYMELKFLKLIKKQ